jgi:hypothetical protein
LYGADTWALPKVDQKYPRSTWMWCWRKMKKIGWTNRVLLHHTKQVRPPASWTPQPAKNHVLHYTVSQPFRNNTSVEKCAKRWKCTFLFAKIRHQRDTKMKYDSGLSTKLSPMQRHGGALHCFITNSIRCQSLHHHKNRSGIISVHRIH